MNHVLIDISLPEIHLNHLRSLPEVTVEILPGPKKDGTRFVDWELLKNKQILLCKWPPKNLTDAKDLKLIQIVTVGFEHLKEFQFQHSPIRVCNARGMFDTAIAEWNLAMMINLVRDLRGMIRNQESKTWDRSARYAQEIRGKTVGIWGYGGIGRETARLAKLMGMKIHILSRSGIKPRLQDYTPNGTGDPHGLLPDRVFVEAQKMDFLADLDFLIIALPRTQTTDGMIGEAELRSLPKQAFVLNPARGPIIQEQALLQALRDGWIAGAAIDTHYVYPLPTDHPLWSFPNVILTPHISGADQSINFPDRIGELFVQNVERFLTNQPLWNEVTKEEWAAC